MLRVVPELFDGALFEPSDKEEVDVMVDLLDLEPGQKAVDLGSGDGKLVIAMARKGAQAYGLEKDAPLVRKSQENIAEAGLSRNAVIYHVDFWDVNLSQFHKIAMFQYYTVMERLEKKLLEELMPGSFVVSNHWTFPRWQPVKEINDIYLYVR
jgi:cyclopropane fatty-acyl-phospholipid synthase-like methyltransferase